ncbi:polar amino acid ABC transporter inner membrane subunit [Caballeronia arvi]|uniref:Polar amino acid ABC transporter inner membrane subunit n=1 Tax=Caballeronia arvi TaxID=1777135 RepID=A0A158I861_9BURK|nr:ABC transporter permease subunit [Caballeronia arvi]SAL52563.1 polar amino acid ABC transporter inner membrane subunit [Caballeronia arvi]
MPVDINFMLDTMRQLLAAVPTTLALFFASLVLGGLLSLVIVAMRVSPHWLPRNFGRFYIFVFRGSPLLIQMFLVYYGLGQFGVIRHSFLWPVLREPYVCAVLSLALCTAGYTAEIIRGGLMAIPHGQIEAGYSIGLSGFALLRRVIGPIALRLCLPAYSTEAVLLVKSTALASLVTVWEVTGVAQEIIHQTYRTTEVFMCAALIYLLLNFAIVRVLGFVERRLSGHLRPPPTPAVASSAPVQTRVAS